MPTKQISEYGDILTPKDVQTILHIGENQLYKLLTSGDIRNFKIGRSRKIPKQCLLDYINLMTQQDT